MFQYIEPVYFFIAFFIGISIVYLTTPLPEIIIKYPTLENAGKIVYKDSADVCYKYRAVEVGCPADKSKIEPMKFHHMDGENKEQKSTLITFLTELKNKAF